MYEKSTNIPLPATASYLISNLSILHLRGKTYVGVIHRGEFIIICVSDENTAVNRTVPKLSPQQVILEGQWIWEETPLLVLLSTSSLHIFDWDGAILLHTHHLPSQNGLGFASLKGVAGLPSGRICVGVQNGEMLILNLKDSNNLAFVEERKMKLFSHPITNMASKKRVLAVSDSRGGITICLDNQSVEKKVEIQPFSADSCITCLELSQEAVFAGYISGHIRIFDTEIGVIRAEVCAHARLITGLNIAKDSQMMLSVSEDSFVRVWKVDISSRTLIEHKFSLSEKNHLLIGAKFMDNHGTAFIASAYDVDYLLTYYL